MEVKDEKKFIKIYANYDYNFYNDTYFYNNKPKID